MKDISPIFIIGSPRSGTTLLRLILNRHSRIAIPEETWYFPDLYKRLEKFFKQKDWRFEVAGYIKKCTTVHFPELDESEIFSGLVDINKNEVPNILATINRLFAIKDNKPRWGDKTPGYVLHLPLLKNIFPEAKVVHIIRDGRDVVPSILKYWEVGPQTYSFIETAYYWKNHVKTGQKFGPRLFGKNYMELRYEDLVSNPIEHTKIICEFIDEEFEPGMLETKGESSSQVPDWEWHKKTKEKISNDRVGKWKNNMDSYELTVMHCIGRKIFLKKKYEIARDFNFRAILHVILYNIDLCQVKLKHFIYTILKKIVLYERRFF